MPAIVRVQRDIWNVYFRPLSENTMFREWESKLMACAPRIKRSRAEDDDEDVGERDSVQDASLVFTRFSTPAWHRHGTWNVTMFSKYNGNLLHTVNDFYPMTKRSLIYTRDAYNLLNDGVNFPYYSKILYSCCYTITSRCMHAYKHVSCCSQLPAIELYRYVFFIRTSN